MKHLRIFCIVLGSLFAVILPLRLGNTCGLAREERTLSIMDYQLANPRNAIDSMLLQIEDLQAYYENQQLIRNNENIVEWQGRFCNLPDSNDIDYVIYKAPQTDLDELRAATNPRSAKNYSHFALQDNSFAEVIRANGCLEVIDYLIFAKRCEVYVLPRNTFQNRQIDQADVYKRIQEGRQAFRDTKSPFLRLRYAYQIIRLAHYIKDYVAVLKLHDDLMPKIPKLKSIVNYWIMGHRAGALQSLGRRSEAAYLFSLVFRNCPSKRESAYRSFDIRSEQEWRQTINLCKTEEEQATLYAMRASASDSKGVTDMQQLYTLEPKNELLELILVRETVKLEKVLLGRDFRQNSHFTTAQMDKAGFYLLQLRDFVHQCVREKQVKTPLLWQTIECYLTVLAGDHKSAKQMIAQTLKNTPADNILFLDQLDAIEVANKICYIEQLDTTTDRIIFDITKSDAYTRDTDFVRMLEYRSSYLYNKEGAKGMAFLAQYSLNDLALHSDLDMLDDILGRIRRPKKTYYENSLLTRKGGVSIEGELWDVRGSHLLALGELEAAKASFERVPVRERIKKQFNPFSERWRDCHDCSPLDTGSYDKLKLVEKLLDLEYKAKANLDSGAIYYYRLGVAFYNMTYFGDSPMTTDFYRSGASWQRMNKGTDIIPIYGRPRGNKENFDCSLAMAYFEKARQLAGNNPELGAKSAYMAARCEQNNFFASRGNNYIWEKGKRAAPQVPEKYRRYFSLLKNSPQYNRTQFYQEAIKECKYLRFYVSR